MLHEKLIASLVLLSAPACDAKPKKAPEPEVLEPKLTEEVRQRGVAAVTGGRIKAATYERSDRRFVATVADDNGEPRQGDAEVVCQKLRDAEAVSDPEMRVEVVNDGGRVLAAMRCAHHLRPWID